MKSIHLLKLFGHNNIFLEADIRRVEEELDLDLGHRQDKEEQAEKNSYLQFSEKLRTEAARMAQHYAIFYCLENFIRELIATRLFEHYGTDWWNVAVPDQVKQSALANQTKEKKAGVTPRSPNLIDYTNFGELGEIIRNQWDILGDMFRDKSAVDRILYSLNMLRAPIAHCKPLAEDEILRLQLALKDWFRQMS